MVISRSLGRKRKVRTNKRRMMKGGETSYSTARNWFLNEFLKVIVPTANIKPVIKVGADPIPTDLMMDESAYTYADSIINFYNYANSNSKYREYFKKELIEKYDMFRDLSDFEINKHKYKRVLQNDEVNKKRIEEYDSLNMVKRIIEKYSLYKRIMQAVKETGNGETGNEETGNGETGNGMELDDVALLPAPVPKPNRGWRSWMRVGKSKRRKYKRRTTKRRR